MADPVRHLRVVEHDEHGQVIEPGCPECLRRIDTIAGLERDIRGWTVRHEQLKRDRIAEAEEHPCWEAGIWLFKYWQRHCNHPRSRWAADRFWLVQPFLELKRWGPTLKARVGRCCLAVDGAEFDAWTVQRKNGAVKRFDEFDRIFATTGSYEEFQKRAPDSAKERFAGLLATEVELALRGGL